MNNIIYVEEGLFGYGGGFSDRIGGIASLFNIAKYFGANLYIRFESPFAFFDLFPDQKQRHKYDETKLLNGECFKINLIDRHFNQNINDAFAVLMNNNNVNLFVQTNCVRRVYFCPSENRFRSDPATEGFVPVLNQNQGVILKEFGGLFLRPEYAIFGKKFHSVYPLLLAKNVLGIQIRVGGTGLGWVDDGFDVPDMTRIKGKLFELRGGFEAVFISSDSAALKKHIISQLEPEFEVLSLDESPAHLERSERSEKINFFDSAVADHCLLRLCRAGIVTSGGGYGRSAAWIESLPLHVL